MNDPRATVEQQQPSALPVRPATLVSVGPFEPCQECGAPLERQQRYCVNCAARSDDASNPASRYFAAASRQRRRPAAAVTAGGSAPPNASSARTAGVFFFALLPIAVAIGVVVGRTGADDDQQAIIDALKESGGGAGLASTGAGVGAAEAAADKSTELLPSDFALDNGYTVEIDALPIHSTDQGAADAAVSHATDNGAKDVGIINPGDFRTTPDQGQDDYILYSGEFKSKSDAEKALAELKKDFPDAAVIEVESSATGGGNLAAAGGGGKVVAHTSHGDLHQVAGAPPPTEDEIKRSTEIVNQIANEEGEDYTDTQQQLPDVIPVGGDPNNAPPLPTGAGD